MRAFNEDLQRQDQGATHLNDSLDVERANGAKVDDLNVDTLLSEELGGLEAVANRLGVRNDGNVGTLLLDLALADGEDEVVLHGGLGHGEGGTVHELVLEEDDGVRVADGGLVEGMGRTGWRRVVDDCREAKGEGGGGQGVARTRIRLDHPFTFNSPLQSSAL